MNFTNANIAQLLRTIAAACQIKGKNRFQIAAYENAASAIEHATSEAKDLWEQGTLDEIPGIGEKLSTHLAELFTKGRVAHFDVLTRGIPREVYPLLEISGVGPKTAMRLVESGVTSISDLEQRIDHGILASHGWSEKSLEKIKRGVDSYKKRDHRMLLPFAAELAQGILSHLRANRRVLQAEASGSLRRHVATIGDIDIVVSSADPKAVVAHFVAYPLAARVVEQGDTSATLELKNGRTVDLMVAHPEGFGALLQHFTGSKQHNIHLRTLAREKGYSVSEYGIRRKKQFITCETEDALYSILSMQTPAPELREDRGEIEAALHNKLPDVISTADIRGDLHIHTDWSDGTCDVRTMIDACQKLGYEYIALTDHSYPSLNFKGRAREIEQAAKEASIRVLVGLEVNIAVNGSLQVDDAILSETDFVIAAIHTGFSQDKHAITQRMLIAIAHPKVAIIAHPTGRILLEREGYEADWETVFDACITHKKALEINAYPNRLDLPDMLVKQAVSRGVSLVINTDSHDVAHLQNMRYGVSVARRGWARASDILNTLPLDSLCDKLAVSRK